MATVYKDVKKWTFDSYLAYQLQRIAFVKGGEFNVSDVKEYLRDIEYLSKLYHKEYNATWGWDKFTDRMHRHLNRVVKHLGGARQKIRNRWVYQLSPGMFIHGNPGTSRLTTVNPGNITKNR